MTSWVLVNDPLCEDCSDTSLEKYHIRYLRSCLISPAGVLTITLVTPCTVLASEIYLITITSLSQIAFLGARARPRLFAPVSRTGRANKRSPCALFHVKRKQMFSWRKDVSRETKYWYIGLRLARHGSTRQYKPVYRRIVRGLG